MLVKLAMRYNSLTFIVARIFIITHAQYVTLSVKWKMASSLCSWLQKGKQLSPLLPSCDDPCDSTSVANRQIGENVESTIINL